MKLKLLPLFLSVMPAHEIISQEKPNILFIFADDMTVDALDAIMSEREVISPNLDRLRESGTFFTHAFNQGSWSGAVSAASRAMLTTGRYLWNACNRQPDNPNFARQMAQNWPKESKPYVHNFVQQEKYWPQYMSEAGYKTYMTGKWHVIASPDKVFDVVKHVKGGMPKESMDYYERKFIKGREEVWTPYDKSKGGFWEGGKHWSEVTCEDALEFIDDAKGHDKPFFMYIAFNAPHDPRQSPKEYIDMYPADKISIPKSFAPMYPYKDFIGCGPKLRDANLAPFPRNRYSVQVNRQEYYALITHLDVQIGKILDALEKSGKKDNTYIFFTADHGISIGERGLFGKQNMYDESVRVPLIVSGPGVKKGKTLHNMVYLQDIMASAMDLADSKDMDKIDFKSLMPLAKGETKESRKAIYGGYYGLQRMVRTDRYKMIIYPIINVVRLYDLKKDPLEMNDIAADSKNKPLMDNLLLQLKYLQKEVNDQLDVTPYYNNFFKTL